MYILANFQDASIYNKKVTREEVELFDQNPRKSISPNNAIKVSIIRCHTLLVTPLSIKVRYCIYWENMPFIPSVSSEVAENSEVFDRKYS